MHELADGVPIARHLRTGSRIQARERAQQSSAIVSTIIRGSPDRSGK
jgi:hypothetical protein